MRKFRDLHFDANSRNVSSRTEAKHIEGYLSFRQIIFMFRDNGGDLFIYFRIAYTTNLVGSELPVAFQSE